MSASVEQELSLTSSKPILSARRSGVLGFYRFGTIGFATAVLAFALSHVAAEAGQPPQSKERQVQPAQSKEHHAQPVQSKQRHVQAPQSKVCQVQPARSKDRQAQPQSKDRQVQPAQSKDRHPQPAQSKDRHAQGAADCNSAHRPSPHRVLHGPDFNPPYADILVDDNSGQVLHETSPDSPRHPASLTKIMTLYLLFEQLETKKLSLDSRLQVSAHASAQAPTKLGLKPNESITVEDAIKAVVTRSANDAAVVIAEAIAGSEPDFAVLMTQKAQMLGMVNTIYVNASGLPAEAQITTAREQALLGCAVQERFPEYSRYFAIPRFQYRGIEIGNHNALLREMQGIDGIKTGYTEASGYNLVASMRRDGRHLIGVVLGEKSNAARNARMRQLIEEHLSQAAPRRTAPSSVPAMQDHLPLRTYIGVETRGADLGLANP